MAEYSQTHQSIREKIDHFQEWAFTKLTSLAHKLCLDIWIFIDIPYRLKNDGVVEFHFTSVKELGSSLILIKKLFLTLTEAKVQDYQYTTLSEAAESLSPKSNFYALVEKVLTVIEWDY